MAGASLAQSGQGVPSRVLEGASLPLRTVPIPMLVRRGSGALTPLPFVPVLLPGDQLILRRPSDLETDMTVMAAALSAQRRLQPVHKFWSGRRVPRQPDDLVLTIPEPPSVVVVMVGLHSSPGAHHAMRRALNEQADRLVESANVFSITSDQRSRWNMFFDALAEMPADREAVTNYRDYADRVAKDVGLRLPREFDLSDSSSVRQGVLQTAEALEKLRNAPPEKLQETYAGLVAPLLPGPYRDYLDVAYAIYRLAFRPRVEPRLVFAPSIPTLGSRDGNRTQVIASRAFPRSGPERTVAFMALRVGNEGARRGLRVMQPRVVSMSSRYTVRVEELGPIPSGEANLLGSPFLWDWRIEIGDYVLPAWFEPGQGVHAEIPEQVWGESRLQEGRLRVRYGADEWLVPGTLRLIRGRLPQWQIDPAAAQSVWVTGAPASLTLRTEPDETLAASDIESVTLVGANGARLVARSTAFSPDGTLRAQFGALELPPGAVQVEVRVRHSAEPATLPGPRLFLAMPGLAVSAVRLGESRVTIEQDQGNRALAVRLGSEPWVTTRTVDSQGRSVFALPRPIGADDRILQVRLEDERVVELAVPLRAALPSFLANAQTATSWVIVGQGARVELPRGLIVAESPLQVALRAQTPYALQPNSQLQFGLKPTGAAAEGTTLLSAVPRGLAAFDDAESPARWVINASVAAIAGAEAAQNQGQLMVRIVDGPEQTSVWTPLLLEGEPLRLVRTPVLRALQRSETETTLDFAANSGVLGVSVSSDGASVAPQLVQGAGLRVTVPGQPQRVYLRVAGWAQRLALELPAPAVAPVTASQPPAEGAARPSEDVQ